MSSGAGRGTLLNIPMLEERYGRTFLGSIGIHSIVILLILYGSYLLPRTVIQIGGPGGGSGGEAYTVGVADELAGGIGMTKPSLVPKPPALLEETAVADKSKAIPLPQTLEPKRTKAESKATKEAAKLNPKSNVIPTAPEPGAGGTGGVRGGSGGGIGGGSGVSIGSGSGGFGDSWYARTVESRISNKWIRPPKGVHVEIIYSFYIASDGSILGIKQEKSSGNHDLDMMAEGAIRAVNPLAPPPPEFRGRLIQFVAQFIYPSDQ
jgi:TonB family protein